ncbi:hypothetical protein Dimus_032971 [Dionaea muscipula]
MSEQGRGELPVCLCDSISVRKLVIVALNSIKRGDGPIVVGAKMAMLIRGVMSSCPRTFLKRLSVVCISSSRQEDAAADDPTRLQSTGETGSRLIACMRHRGNRRVNRESSRLLLCVIFDDLHSVFVVFETTFVPLTGHTRAQKHDGVDARDFNAPSSGYNTPLERQAGAQAPIARLTKGDIEVTSSQQALVALLVESC